VRLRQKIPWLTRVAGCFLIYEVPSRDASIPQPFPPVLRPPPKTDTHVCGYATLVRHQRRRNIQTHFGVDCYWHNAKLGKANHAENQMNVTELNPGNLTIAPLLLLKLIRDLALLEEELRTAEDTIGQPVSSYQVPLAERLCRVGVGDQKVEDFIAWWRSISSLITDSSNDETQLAKIVAAEAAGMAVFAELIASIKSRGNQGRLQSLAA
jgi:hypothetical protein